MRNSFIHSVLAIILAFSVAGQAGELDIVMNHQSVELGGEVIYMSIDNSNKQWPIVKFEVCYSGNKCDLLGNKEGYNTVQIQNLNSKIQKYLISAGVLAADVVLVFIAGSVLLPTASANLITLIMWGSVILPSLTPFDFSTLKYFSPAYHFQKGDLKGELKDKIEEIQDLAFATNSQSAKIKLFSKRQFNFGYDYRERLLLLKEIIADL